MNRDNSLNISAILAMIGGFITLLYTFYFMQQLSYSIGVYSGISTAIRAYNISNATAGSTLYAAISQSTTLLLALHLTYALLPFAVIMLAISVIWLFSRSYYKFTGSMLVISAIIYIILIAILEFDFSFKNTIYSFPIAYIGCALVIVVGAYSMIKIEYKPQTTKRPLQQISIDSETPYSNMKMLSDRLMKKLSGEIKILDMHFDTNGLDNLMQLVGKNVSQYTQISVLTSTMRLGYEFDKSYSNFKSELANKNVIFELRVLNQEEAAKQHERVLIDGSTAYKIPPLNIINKKNEHIVGINHREAQTRFNNLWAKATKFENLKS